jgi:serine protease AprX
MRSPTVRPRIPVLVALLAAVGALLVAAPALARPQAATQIVRLRPGTTLVEGRALVRAAGGHVTGTLPIINSVAARMSAGSVSAIARDPHVVAVTANSGVAPQAVPPGAVDAAADPALTAPADADPTVPVDPASTVPADPASTAPADATPSPSGGTPQAAVDTSRLASAYPASVFAPAAWGATTGRGVGVAVIDTGIDGDLPDFAGADGTSRVVASVVTNAGATTAADTYGHGTHVAGIIAGDGTRRDAADPAAGRYIGIAPEANLVSIKAGDDDGNATILDVINGLQFVVDHKDDYGIRVVNLSLESTTAESYQTDPLDAAVEAAWFHGIVVVAAAGNRGTAPDAADHAPGNDPFVITVGAVDDQGTQTPDDDAYATWSSVGRTQDGVDKPDVGAPGAHIVSTLAPGSDFTRLCPDCIVDGEYIRAGGTSMAAPVVSGVAALMLQRHPDWTPDQVKGTILATRRQLPGGVEEVDAQAATAQAAPTTANTTGRATNDLIDPTTGGIDYARSSWSRSSWSTAPDALAAGWARSSWSCACAPASSAAADATRSSWSRSSWSTRWSY